MMKQEAFSGGGGGTILPPRDLENWSGGAFHLDAGPPCLLVIFSTAVLLCSSVPDLQI
jgi:hypothetical protein